MAARLRVGFALSLALLVSACGMKENMEQADKEIERFHAYYDKQNYAAIWRTTSGEFRKITKEKEFEKLLVAVRTKLGAVKKVEQAGWQANTMNGVSTVVINTKTAFEKGEGIETFTYVKQDSGLKLLGYNINSAALIYN
ncbi:DUF4019 domain-containing protein [Altererythrobacter sp. CC-YST694]|uniref:DUF4019 domain-containing protein n=1 Tax=Altererythrobacter sp. CC-YST694 TaxID=2755038 RepID=UPI001D024D2E|nr:DUF4019 domain-containing protein [Altererythrobacter sp. CC-YST694]MCB5424240.1 DUF4019 domain-containing protein [Altererythrobacter sp. CC-YST694]